MKTVYCQECGKEIPIDGEKCPFCNASLAWVHNNNYEAPDVTPRAESTKDENSQKEDGKMEKLLWRQTFLSL